MPRICRDAKVGHGLSYDPANRQGFDPAPLDEAALNTGIHAMVRFVRTLQQDIEAVEAAVSQPWSNGPVEGQINRLKMLKRQMYGRGGTELLRARLLPEPLAA